MTTEEFTLIANDAIIELAKHFGLNEQESVAAYAQLITLTERKDAVTFKEYKQYITDLVAKPLSSLTKEEVELCFMLKLLRMKTKPFIKDEVLKLSRNDKCPCQSGKKFKHCCLEEALAQDKERYVEQNTYQGAV